MGVMPFICLGIGIIAGLLVKVKCFFELTDIISSVALAMLMINIGVGIGIDKSIFNSLPEIGLNCLIISIFAIVGSVLLTVLCEKTVLPLKKIDLELSQKRIQLDEEKSNNSQGDSIVWIMPICIILGVIIGSLFRTHIPNYLVDKAFTVFLIILYVCVGVSQAANKEVFHFVKILGVRVFLLPVAILIGSIGGGYIAGIVLEIPQHVSTIAASGMSYYSITGAFMTETYGVDIGAYGFLVNVIREFLTVLLMPILIKISIGSPIAGGAAGNMDTMLAPVTKFVGVRLGLVTLVTGTILTFMVPFLLPLLASVL